MTFTSHTRASALNASLALSSDSVIASLAVPTSTGVSATWSYALTGSNCIANQLSVPVSKTNFSAVRTMRFANVTWNQNSARDAVRIATGSTLKPISSLAYNSPTTVPAAPTAPAAAASASTISNPICGTIGPNLGGTQNIALVHGIWSNSCAWTRMANWINQDFRFNNEIIPTMGTQNTLINGKNALISPQGSNSYIDQTGGANTGQGAELMQDINAYPGSNYILVGHSQGGLISRYAAQFFQGTQSNPVRGGVTGDTPNLGANLTSNLSNGISMEFDSFAQQMGCYFGGDCFLELVISQAAAGFGAYSKANDPVWTQLEPNSTFLNNLNAPTQPESFMQAGIVGLTDQRWAFSRVAANAVFNCNPEASWCGERAVANEVEDVYEAMEIVDDISSFWCFDLCNLSAPFASDTALLDTIDSEFNGWIDFPNDKTSAGTVYSGQSDAIVQASSQFYPKSSAQSYIIPHADSHTGALRSDRVHPQLYNALLAFKVPTQASCPFVVPLSQDSFSGSAISSSFPLTTQAGCLWSAVSQSPWITVTPTTNGTSSSTIAFAVEANPSNTPRWGSINVGNGGSTRSFSVYQGGPCIYTFSPGSEASIQPTGGTGTVNVTTYMNCPWTAVSEAASWLNVSAGAGGTGSGSFTWTAQPNAGGGDRIGVINVMGQSFTVVDGSPVGAPSTATVTIQGSPGSYTFTPPCPTYCGTVTVPASGSISVTVGGQTFATGYGGSINGSTIAAALASEMNNYPDSLVSAVVTSGTTISILSTVSGAATNYPLSTSSTFNPSCSSPVGGATYCFTTPAFTGITSSSYLLGGAD